MFASVCNVCLTPGTAQLSEWLFFKDAWAVDETLPLCIDRNCCCHCPALPADSKCVLTACDDMHAHLYDAEHAELIEAFSGAHSVPSSRAYGKLWRWPLQMCCGLPLSGPPQACHPSSQA